MPRALIISFVEWAGAFQRPQHQAVEMARQGWDVTYLGPAYPHRPEPGLGAGFELPINLTVTTARALPLGKILSVIERYNESSFRNAVAEMNDKMNNVVWDAVIFNDPRWAEAASVTRATVRIWDRMDDLSESAPTAAWGREREADALRLADVIWTGTPSLEDLTHDQLNYFKLDKPVKFISCGADAERFGKIDVEAARAAREEMGGIPDRPLGLYFGAINERLETPFLEALIHSDWRIALIGPGSLSAPRLKENKSLRILGPRAYESLPDYLAGADAGLIPYSTEGANRHLYPVKALEYLAGGKPVLSTPLPNIKRLLSDYVWMGERPQDWKVLGGKWEEVSEDLFEKARAGQEFVGQRTWETMADELITDLYRAIKTVRGGGRLKHAGGPVRPAGSRDLRTQSDAANGRITKGGVKPRRAPGPHTRAREARARQSRIRESRVKDSRLQDSRVREPGPRESRVREARSNITRGGATRKSNTRNWTRSSERRNPTRRQEVAPPIVKNPLKSPAPPRKFDVRSSDEWGAQSLLARIARKRPPANTAPDEEPGADS